MPAYVYKCNNCQSVFERHQRMTEPPLTDCPICQVGQVRRLINSVGVIFKGNGFYATDNRRNGVVRSEAKVDKTGQESAGPEKEGAKATTPAASPGPSTSPAASPG
ncbi:MAG: FmdB family zinc ribbon protein [Chloroflexota bacterium]